MNRVSVIVPVLNEASRLSLLLAALRQCLKADDELIVVDGGSTDGSAAVAASLADQVLTVPAQRARQMNAGAAVASGDWLWFVHADSRLTAEHRNQLEALPANRCWGRFDVRLDGRGLMFRVIGTMISWRSRLSGIATGDQAMFVRHSRFRQLGGFADQSLMEDIALSQSLKAFSRPVCVRPPVLTSARRWQRHGVWRTIWQMWVLRYQYWRGVDPDILHQAYYGELDSRHGGDRHAGDREAGHES